MPYHKHQQLHEQSETNKSDHVDKRKDDNMELIHKINK